MSYRVVATRYMLRVMPCLTGRKFDCGDLSFCGRTFSEVGR